MKKILLPMIMLCASMTMQAQTTWTYGDHTYTMKGNLTDLMLQFSFTNTNEMQKMKVKPKLKFRKYVEDD